MIQKIHTIDDLDALKMAIQSEKDMRIYYDKASKLMIDDDSRAILQGLSENAETHRQETIDTYSKISGKRILYLNLDKRHKLSTLQRCGSDPNDSVRVAKKNEQELSAFYETVSRRLLDSELRSFFRELANARQQHLVLLESSFVEPLTLDQEPGEEGDENIYDDVPSDDEKTVDSL